MARVLETAVGYPAGVTAQGATRLRRRRPEAVAWLYLLPALAIYGAFWIGPALYSVYLSFFDWDMASPEINTFQALIVPHLAWGFGLFMLRQFFLGIPRELADATALDGCGPLRTLLQVYLPLSRSALVVIAFVVAWNGYYWPLILINTEKMRTLPIGIPRFTGADLDVQWQATMAAATLGTLPVLALYLVAQRQFLEGISRTGLKG